MIFVDTSVWISFFRGLDGNLENKLKKLIDQDLVALAIPVKIELMTGCRAKEQKILTRALSALTSFAPTEQTWLTLETWASKSAEGGNFFGFADMLIAAICYENEGQIWSLDKDFMRMEKIFDLTIC